MFFSFLNNTIDEDFQYEKQQGKTERDQIIL